MITGWFLGERQSGGPMKTFVTIRDLPMSEQPYEKFIQYGPGKLSDAELLAIIIRTGSKEEQAIDVARRLLVQSKTYTGLKGLNYLSLSDLTMIPGIGKVKAIQILSVLELTKRMSKAIHEEHICLNRPDSVANYYMQDMRHLTVEQIILIMMDSKSRKIKDMIISSGTVNASILAPREIFLNALKYEAVNIIILHNHPSGDPTPSSDDIYSTKRIQDAGNLIGIKLMDHIIIGDNRYVSLKERGVI